MKIKYTEEERNEQTQKIKGWLDQLKEKKIFCILRNVSRSGMSRDIDFYIFLPDGTRLYLSYIIAGLLDYPFNDNKGVKVGGCGMDMGFSVVYGLSCLLYEGQDRPGYIIKHEWI